MSADSLKFEPIFCGDADWQANACLNWSHDPIELYAIGYKEAGDRLVEQVLTQMRDLDILVYPIVFLYRQYVELRLKAIIKEGHALLEERGGFPAHHKIWDLWCVAKKISTRVFANEKEPPVFDCVEHVIREFARIDSGSFAFRYPTTKRGDKTLEGVTHINIRRMAEHIDRLSRDLEGISTGISVYRGWQDDMRSACL